MVIATDVKWTDEDGNQKVGFYMDGYLFQNLSGIPRYLDKDFDCISCITGRGKVRVGKSTLGMQVGYLIAWLLAGGVQEFKQEMVNGKQTWIQTKFKSPKQKVKFDLNENVCFSAENLMSTAKKLYEKYGKRQVILYDEGRQGLDSARSMESINKGMEDFMQECGFMNHVIIIVLPNFFKLHEDYAIARSLFLIDCYVNRKLQRGFFSFYNEEQKEKLYYFGKKRIGVTAKYFAAKENFYGRFSSFMPFDKKEYEKLKKKAIDKKRLTRTNIRFKRQRDAAIFLITKYGGLTSLQIAEELSIVSNEKIKDSAIRYAIANVTKKKVEDIE